MEDLKLGVEREKMSPDEPGEVDIRPSGLDTCIGCSEPITPDNDSHWQGFSVDLPDGMTGPLCIECDLKSDKLAMAGVKK